jgi:hypothetical protein
MTISRNPISGFFGSLESMSGRRHLRSQGHIEPGVNVDDLTVHTRALRRLRRDLFQALPPIPSRSLAAATPEGQFIPPLGARARRCSMALDGVLRGIKRNSEDLVASSPPSTKRYAYAPSSDCDHPLVVPRSQRLTKIVQWPLLPSFVGGFLNSGLLLDMVPTPPRPALQTEGGIRSQGLGVVTPPPIFGAPVRQSSESPTIPPPPRRRSFYDPSLFFNHWNSPAGLSRINGLPLTPTASFNRRSLVFSDNSSQPTVEDDLRPLNLADYPPGTRVLASEAKRLFPGDLLKFTLGPNYANCRNLSPSDPLNWIIPFSTDQGASFNCSHHSSGKQ